MQLKNIFVACLIAGGIFILIAGILYKLGGHNILNTKGSYSTELMNEKITKEEYMENIESIKINTRVSNVYFEYSDEDTLKIELINPLKKSKSPIIINNIDNTLTVDINKTDKVLNWKANMIKHNVGSHLKIFIPNKYKGNMDITSDVGEIRGEYSGKQLNLSTNMGDIDLEVGQIESCKILTDVGNIKLKVNEKDNLTFDLQTSVGEIKNNLKNTSLNSSNTGFPGISQEMNFDTNEGGSLIKLESSLGDIKVYN